MTADDRDLMLIAIIGAVAMMVVLFASMAIGAPIEHLMGSGTANVQITYYTNAGDAVGPEFHGAGWTDLLSDGEQVTYESVRYLMADVRAPFTTAIIEPAGSATTLQLLFVAQDFALIASNWPWMPLVPSLSGGMAYQEPDGMWPDALELDGFVDIMVGAGPVVSAPLSRFTKVSEHPTRNRLSPSNWPAEASIVTWGDGHHVEYRAAVDWPITRQLSITRVGLDFTTPTYVLHHHPYLAGDANKSRTFDQFDVVQMLRSNTYLAPRVAWWDTGDFTQDGWFNQLDLVAALQQGTYLAGPYLAVPEPGSALLLALGVAALLLPIFR